MNPLRSNSATIISGFIVAVIIALALNAPGNRAWSLAVWLHVFVGVIWLGLLYYFNFVQVPALATAVADADGPGPEAIGKYVTPLALLWFRWAAVATWITGVVALQAAGWGLINVFLLQTGVQVIGIGAWLGTIMLLNVWLVIWPNQKKILGLVKVTELEVEKAKMVSIMASRINTLLSIPMLMCMVGQNHGLPL